MTQVQPHIQLSSDMDVSKAILVGDPARLDILKTFLEDAHEVTYNREFRSVVGYYKSTKVLGLSTGVGAPSAVIAIEELAQIGVKEAIRVGSAGAYQDGIELGQLLIATGVVRDDGLSKQYVPVNYPAVPSLRLIHLAKKYAQDKTWFGIIRSHDGFYMDDNAETEAYWSHFGVLGADMESGAVMTVGDLRGVETLSILNNVVLWQGDLQEGVNNLVNEGEIVAQGERDSLQLALDILTDKGV